MKKRHISIILLMAVSAFMLWLTFHNVEFSEVIHAMQSRADRWYLFLLSGLVMMLNIIFRGFRYHRILSHYPQVRLKSAINMTAIMFLGNSILPFRAGEAIRVFLPNRRYGIPIATTAAFHAADRLFDIIGMLVLLVLSLFFAGDGIAQEARTRPIEFFGTSYTFDGLINGVTHSSILMLLVGLGGVFAICVFPEQMKRLLKFVLRPFKTEWQSKAVHLVDQLHGGMAVFRSARDVVWVLFWTGLIWWMVILNVQFLGWVFEVNLNWAEAGLIVFLVAIAVSLPQAPGYVGGFDLGFKLSLEICFGVASSIAVTMALAAHFFQIIPVTLLGFACLSLEGLSFHTFAEAQEEVAEEEETIL